MSNEALEGMRQTKEYRLGMVAIIVAGFVACFFIVNLRQCAEADLQRIREHNRPTQKEYPTP